MVNDEITKDVKNKINLKDGNMIRIHSKDLKLEPLSIPPGFGVSWNQFYSILDEGKPIYIEDDEFWQNFPYDMYKNTLLVLHFRPVAKKSPLLLIDMGWAPDQDPEGSFYITILRWDDEYWEHPLLKFSSRYKADIVDMLNKSMMAIYRGEFQ